MYCEAAFGVDGDALGIADQHVDDAVHVADALDVLVQRQRPRSADDVDLRPELLAGRVRATLLVRPRDEHD